MLRSLTAKQLLEWEEYARLEPFNAEESHADWRTAAILKHIFDGNQRLINAILAAAGAKPHQRPKFVETELKDFLLQWNANTSAPKKKQTWQEQFQIVSLINKAFSEPEGHA